MLIVIINLSCVLRIVNLGKPKKLVNPTSRYVGEVIVKDSGDELSALMNSFLHWQIPNLNRLTGDLWNVKPNGRRKLTGHRAGGDSGLSVPQVPFCFCLTLFPENHGMNCQTLSAMMDREHLKSRIK